MSNALGTIRAANIVLTAIGAAAFAAFFLYVTLAPKDFDSRTRSFAIAKVKAKIDVRISKVAQSRSANKAAEIAGVLSKRLEKKIRVLRDSLDAGVAKFIADVLAAACKLDCERRDEVAESITAFYASTIARYGLALDRVKNLIESEYDAIMDKLRNDLKIFSGTSFAALFFAFLISIFRGKAAAHLLPFSIALSLATAIAGIWYVFGQDWVMAMIFSNYWGWAYPAVLSTISIFLLDIAFNRARATTSILNIISSVLSGTIRFIPC